MAKPDGSAPVPRVEVREAVEKCQPPPVTSFQTVRIVTEPFGVTHQISGPAETYRPGSSASGGDLGKRYGAGVRARPPIDLRLTIAGEPTESETTCTWAGAHVLTVDTVVPRSDLALELHSTFVGHPGLPTHVIHLRLGSPGHEPSITAADEDHLEPTFAPRACAYEHAQRLIEILSDLGHCAGVNVSGDSAFYALERVGPRAL